MMSLSYVDGIKDKVSHDFASSLTADLIAADEATITISVVCPDRWFLGDFAVVTSRDGGAFAGEVEGMDVSTGEVTIRGAGQLSARVTPLPGLRALASGHVAAEGEGDDSSGHVLVKLL
jgi:sarcosine oxidase gamma subunit